MTLTAFSGELLFNDFNFKIEECQRFQGSVDCLSKHLFAGICG